MKVWVEPMDVTYLDTPTVYVVVRQVGRHKDVEAAPVASAGEAVEWAARRWGVPVKGVELKPLRTVTE